MMPYQSIGRLLLITGVVLAVVGGLLLIAPRFSPFLEKIPGNIRWQKGPVTVYFPLGLCILISIVLSLLFHFLGRK
ncbi:MAG: DUF2905 domain-containing protein [bacterium]|nr:DUF2905 domain-containing protein [bacterium]